MVAKMSKILFDLTQLLAEDLDLKTISDRFFIIAQVLEKEKLAIKKQICKEYYKDEELALILLMKNEALANSAFEQASKFMLIEQKLLLEKGISQLTQLKTEAAYFEYFNNCIVFHYNNLNEHQRLIANLIEYHNISHNKFLINMVYCSQRQ